MDMILIKVFKEKEKESEKEEKKKKKKNDFFCFRNGNNTYPQSNRIKTCKNNYPTKWKITWRLSKAM